MEPEYPQSQDKTVWPPPPTQGPPTKAAPPEVSKTWVFRQIVGRVVLLGLGYGALGGALFGWILAADPVGGVFGLIFGAIAGLFLGVLDGLALACVTCAAFYPLESAETYRLAIGVLSPLVTLIVGFLLASAVFGRANEGVLNMATVWPPIIASGCSWLASRTLARWYASVFRAI